MATPDDLDEANRIVEASGNAFHAKVLRFLKASGWTVRISPYYSDGISGKPREIDLIAEKAFPEVKDHFGNTKGDVNVRLFIECKYIRQPTVFWMHDQNEQAAFALLERTTPLHQTNVIYTPRHHYLDHAPRRVAKLFASQNAREKETEQEQIFKAMNQVLNATIAWRHTPNIVVGKRCLLTVNYPLVVCNDFKRFFAVDLENDVPARRVSGNFLLEINYAYLDASKQAVAEYFLLDIVSFDGMATFFEAVEKDVGAIAYMMSPS